MSSSSKIVVTIINFFILFWLLFALQRILEIGVEVNYLNAGVAFMASALLSLAIWKQQLNFNTILKYSGLCWLIGFVLGIAYIMIFDPHEAQAAALPILWTAPIGWLLGLSIAIYREKMSIARNISSNDQD